jgi:tetratricopeptide (TPR) repeat protein
MRTKTIIFAKVLVGLGTLMVGCQSQCSTKLATEQGKLEPAESQLDQAKKLEPKDAEADYLSGVVLQRRRQPQKAYEAYASAARKNPGELAYVMAESEMLAVLDRPAEAIELLKTKIAYFEHSAAIHDALGQLLVEQGRYAEGASMLREASVLAMDDQTIREHLAFALYYAKQYHEGAKVFARLLKNDGYARRADVYGALGECQSRDGQLNEARQTLEMATQLDSSCIGYWLGLGRVAAELNDWPGADLAVQRALSMEPTSSEAHCLLGYVRLRQDQLPQALAAFHMANRMDANDTVSLCMQGYVLEQMGRRNEAVQFYARALRIQPNDELAKHLMASAE